MVGSIRRKGMSRVLDYIGKDGVHQINTIAPATQTNRMIITLLDELCANKTRKDLVFKLGNKYWSATKVRDYFAKITGTRNVHKIRTLRGTTLAVELLDKLVLDLDSKRSLNQGIVDKAFKAELTKVGTLLGHVKGVGTTAKPTWSTASQSYIDPEVQRKFYEHFKTKGIQLPSFLRKKTMSKVLAEFKANIDSHNTTVFNVLE
jgi:hypothetical protein